MIFAGNESGGPIMLPGSVDRMYPHLSRYLAYTLASVNQRRIQLGGNRGGKSIMGRTMAYPSFYILNVFLTRDKEGNDSSTRQVLRRTHTRRSQEG